jgi:hypothetical protein
MFLSVIFVLLFSQALKVILAHLEKTHFHRLKYFLVALISLIFLLTSIVPSITYASQSLGETVNSEEAIALEWLRSNTNKADTVLSTLQEGVLITSLANRKNVADYNFLLIEDANTRLKDIRTIYTALFQTEAVRLLNKYNVKYIYFSERARNEFNIQELAFIDDKCFELVYDGNVKIYRSLCMLQEG